MLKKRKTQSLLTSKAESVVELQLSNSIENELIKTMDLTACSLDS